jgi:hypothetical protein
MSSGNFVSIRSIEEVTYNTTPVDDAGWEQMRYTSESLSSTPNTDTSNEVRNDRQTTDQFLTGNENSGSVNGELSAGTYDLWLQGALAGTWTTNVLKAGIDEYSYSLEKEYEDLTGTKYILFTGQRVSTFDLNVAYGSAVTCSFGFAGAGITPGTTSAVGAGSVTAANTNRIINTVNDVVNVDIDTVAFAGCLNSFTLNVNNNLRPQTCIGSADPSDQLYGSSLITGSIEVYLDANTMAWYTTNILNQTSMQIEFRLTDGTRHYDFDLPNCKLSGSAPAGEGLNTDTMVNATFTALYDATAQTALQITRTP